MSHADDLEHKINQALWKADPKLGEAHTELLVNERQEREANPEPEAVELMGGPRASAVPPLLSRRERARTLVIEAEFQTIEAIRQAIQETLAEGE
jgi:hypothetical protein